MNQKTGKEMAAIACKALDEKKAVDIEIIDIEQVSTIADYFIIASGNNVNQVQAMADYAEEMLGKAGCVPKQIEGYRGGSWILMDYGDLVIHIFDQESRSLYDLSRIWRDGTLVDKKDL